MIEPRNFSALEVKLLVESLLRERNGKETKWVNLGGREVGDFTEAADGDQDFGGMSRICELGE